MTHSLVLQVQRVFGSFRRGRHQRACTQHALARACERATTAPHGQAHKTNNVLALAPRDWEQQASKQGVSLVALRVPEEGQGLGNRSVPEEGEGAVAEEALEGALPRPCEVPFQRTGSTISAPHTRSTAQTCLVFALGMDGSFVFFSLTLTLRGRGI